MKKIAVLSLPLLLSTPSSANFAYIGVGVGAQMQRTSYEIRESRQNFRVNGSEQDAMASIMAGYQHYFDESWFGAVEIEALGGKSESKINFSGILGETGPVQASLEHAGSFGAAVKLGRTFSKTSFYIRAGLEGSRFKIKAHNSGTIANPEAVRTINQNKTKAAFVPGLGMEFKTSEQFIVGLEVRTAFYKATQFRGQTPDPALLDITDFRVKVKPRMDQALITIKYLFK